MEPTNARREDRLAAVLLWMAIGVGAALRIALALGDDGTYWPDEIYQSLEPAHRLVFGYGLIPWEFAEGARNWALPGGVAAALKLLTLAGLEHPAAYVRGLKVLFALAGVATIGGVWRLARAHGASGPSAAVAALGFALLAPAVYFAPRGMSEPLSTLPLVFGLAWALPSTPGDRRVFAGASLLGVATLLRLQNGLFCVGLLAVLLARRAWRQAGIALLTLLVWAFLFGLLDRLTWGSWFHSAAVYLRFNLLEGKAAQWGTSHASYYARTLFTSAPGATLVLTALSLCALSRARGLLLITFGFLVAHSFIPHKELRFVFAALPLLCALAALGADAVRPQARQLALGALVLTTVLSAVRHRSLTFGQLGQYEGQRPAASAYDDFGPVNRLLFAAHGREDLCGLKIESVHLAWTGGHTHLHREVPLYPHNGPQRRSGHFNYVITRAGAVGEGGGGGEVVAAEGNQVLVRLRETCVPDSGFSWRLP